MFDRENPMCNPFANMKMLPFIEPWVSFTYKLYILIHINYLTTINTINSLVSLCTLLFFERMTDDK